MADLTTAADDNDNEPVTPLIDGLLSRGELTHFVGLHGAGKSFIATSIAFHIAVELPWGKRPTHQHLIVYNCPHDGGETRRRLLACAEHHDVPLPRHLRRVQADIRIDPQALVDEITRKLEPEYGPCGLIVLDFGHVFSPDWAQLGEIAQRLRDDTGAAVMMLQEGGAIASSPGWDNLWSGKRSLDDLIVFSVEHMRRSSLLGRRCSRSSPSARPP
jgi:hypothetical protein